MTTTVLPYVAAYIHVYSWCITSGNYSDVFYANAHECCVILSSLWCNSTVLRDTCPQEMEQFVVLCRYRRNSDLNRMFVIAVPGRGLPVSELEVTIELSQIAFIISSIIIVKDRTTKLDKPRW